MPQINKSSDYFNTKLYTGNGSTQSISGIGFQPDLVWVKQRNGTGWHQLVDAVRGSGKRINSNDTGAEYNDVNGLTSFDSDGFSLGTSGDYNGSGNTQVSWNWLGANGTASNTDGSITSNVSASTTSGFSIVSYTGTGANATIGHGLGSAPGMIITKTRSITQPWRVYHKELGATFGMILNDTSVKDDDNTAWNDTEPTSSVFSVGTSANTNGSGSTFIAYCFAEKKSFSKFGSYTGNGNADGPFIYTGFKPAFVLQKRADSTSNWHIFDNKREPENVMDKFLAPNDSGAEGTATGFDFLSNGFKSRTSSFWNNQSGGTYIYMAFAESPLVGTNNTPATAR